MAWRVLYVEKALLELQKLPKSVARRILDKVAFYARQPNPLHFAKKLTDPRFGTYRFRVGDYRIIFDIDQRGKIEILFILSVKHRKEVYKF